MTPHCVPGNTPPMEHLAGPAVLGGLSLLFVILAIAFLKRARRKRRELFAEPELRVFAEPTPEAVPAARAQPEAETEAETETETETETQTRK